ncbi:MAG TPA: DUF2207 domain-containing protein [Acidimicrobiales bacterium]|nr:DUF2207 domain-containing protein [Acidimicrobiales bacterium]
MRTTTRRRLDMGLLAGGALVVGVSGLIGAAAGKVEKIDAVWTRAAVRADGSAQVLEVIDWDFGWATDKHGIFRQIPDLPVDTPVTVEADAPDQLAVTSEANGTRLRIGDPNTTVSGKHRYELEYLLPGVVRENTLDWETFGYQWDVDIDEAEVHVTAPFDLTDPVCSQGRPGSTAPCDVELVEPGHLVARVENLDAGEGVSIEARTGGDLAATPSLPEPPTERPSDDGTGLGPPAALAAAATVAAALPASRLVRRAGRERISSGGAADVAYTGYGRSSAASAPVTSPAGAGPGRAALPPFPLPPFPPPPSSPRPGSPHPGSPPPAGYQPSAIGPPVAGPPGWLPAGEMRIDEKDLAEMATTEFAPPAELTAAQGGILLTESVRNEHKVAWLVQAAIDGAVDIEEEGDRATGLRRTGPGDAEAQPVLDAAFGGRDHISLGTYDRRFSTGWTRLGQDLEEWRRHSGLWDDAADRRRIAVRVLGGVGCVVGELMVLGGAFAASMLGAPWLALVLVGAVVAGAGLACLVRGWELRVRTPAGSGLWLRVESFRRFLAGSEAYHAEEAARRGVLREYTAWALALGEIDRWANAVRMATNIPSDAGLSYAYLGPALLASTVSAATAPSSSSGVGGFGGGSVGGGAGGGGGGSW